MFSVNPHLVGRRPLLEASLTPMEATLTDEWEVAPSEIIVDRSLGEGAFGEVYKGILKGPISCSKVRPSMRAAVSLEVAIKLLKCKIHLYIISVCVCVLCIYVSMYSKYACIYVCVICT